ncbi:Ras family protein [Tritrichomonas foetus]|uniref:Ras family protein n=1 Tax=Tritrichomonas foetus TaxID=1144522 RepID=A0A1J4KKD4_9EUKA|nr:Ras family protein [Tritrichomonas foetus]|eukprot:OHT11759.1 Ras family protein [Tritrichomonas foetus]
MSETDIGFGFKVIFVGNSGVGKTAAVQKFCFDRFPESHTKTLASQFYERSFELQNSSEAIDLMIWDTPGRECLSLLAADAFSNANICVVFYSFTDRASFEAVPQWVEKVKSIAVNVQIVLVENKVDLLQYGQVAFDDAQRMATQLEAPLFRVSVREGLNLRNLFTFLAVTLQSKFLSSMNSLPRGSDAFFVSNVDDQATPETPKTEKQQSSTTNAAGNDAGYCNIA